MEFLKKHKRITENEINNIKVYIIEHLKNSFQKNRTTLRAIEILSNDIFNILLVQSFIHRYRGYFENCYRTLMNHNNLYDSKKTDSVYHTLEDEVYTIFLPKLELAKKQEDTKEELDNISYEDFVSHLLKYKVIKNVLDNLDNADGYFIDIIKLFYESDDYEMFDNTLIEDNRSQITYERAYKIFSNFNKKLKIKKSENEYSISEKQKEISNKLNNQIIKKLNKFNEDEKNLILHSLYKVIEKKIFDKKNIDLAEFLRIIRICQGIDDISLFQVNYTKKFYNQVSKGLDYNTNLKFKEKLKNNLLEKLIDLKVPEVYEYIDSL